MTELQRPNYTAPLTPEIQRSQQVQSQTEAWPISQSNTPSPLLRKPSGPPFAVEKKSFAASTERMSLEVFELLRNSEVLIQANESHLALNLLRVAANQDCRNPLVLHRLVVGLERSQKFSEALIVWRNLLRYDYGFETSYGYAQCLYKLERDEEALQAYFDCMSIIVESRDELFEIYKNVGNILVKQGDYEAAEEYFNKAFAMNKESDVLLVNIATLEYQRSDLEKSLFGFRQAVELNPKNDKAWVGLALVHNKLGDLELSLGNLERAIDLQPLNRTALLLFSAWSTTIDGRVKAVTYLQNYLSENIEDSEMSLLLIQYLCETNQLKNAEIELTKSFFVNPRHEGLCKLYTQIMQSPPLKRLPQLNSSEVLC